jgi:hypothetical protein
MRARKSADAAFGERTDAEWLALGVPQHRLHAYKALPALGWAFLARKRALRPDEVALLERIGTGMVPHPRIDMGRALNLLRDHEGKPRCMLPELCAVSRIGCDCHDDHDDGECPDTP